MTIKLIDYVKDSPIKDGSVFNGMTVRMVDAKTLYDYEGMNPTEAKNLDPKNIMGIKDNEVFLNTDVITDKAGTKETTNHELNEDRELRANPSLTYWEVHCGLQKLQSDPMHNDSINQAEAKAMTDSKIMFKTFRCEVKSADPVTGIIDILIPMSTDSTDRTQESISADAWTKRLPIFMKRPILVSSHNYSDLRAQIGEFMALVPTPQGLMGKPKYYVNQGNEEADWGFNIASKGMAAYSVGFIPYDYTQGKEKGDPTVQYTDCELLEISQVVVPCNRDAIQAQRSKSVNDPVMIKLLDDIEATIEPKPVKKEYSQDEIADQIDFLCKMLEKQSLSPENTIALMRITGDDTPDIDIKSVKARITHAMAACQTAMDTMTEHDKAHTKAFDTHSKSIIRCYNGLKSMLAQQTPEDTDASDDQTAQEAVNIDSIVAKITSKY